MDKKHISPAGYWMYEFKGVFYRNNACVFLSAIIAIYVIYRKYQTAHSEVDIGSICCTNLLQVMWKYNHQVSFYV